MLQAELNNETKMLVDAAIAEVSEIATLPEVTVKIIHIVENPKSTARDLHDVIKNDPALSARILKVVNSAFYGLPGQIASIDRAIVLLGLSAVKNIAIAASMTHLFSGGASIEGFSGAEVWRHSIAVGVASRMISTAQGHPTVEESFLAGMMADLGLLVERQLFTKQLAEVVAQFAEEGGDYCLLEQEVIGANHQAFGMALATKWRFPQPLCTTIGYHHKPWDLAEVNRALPAVVHVASTLACRAQIGFCAGSTHTTFDPMVLKAVRIAEDQIEDVFTRLPEQAAAAETIFAE